MQVPSKEPRPRGDRRQGRDHGGEYEAHKGTPDINVQANCAAGAPKRCCIEKEDAGLESDDFEDELRIVQHIDANLA